MAQVRASEATRSAFGLVTLLPLTLIGLLFVGPLAGAPTPDPSAVAADPSPSDPVTSSPGPTDAATPTAPPATPTATPAAPTPTSAPPTSPRGQLDAAADRLQAATAANGTGYTFEIVQTSTIHAKPGGPKIEVPDPIDRYKSLGFADAYRLDAAIERGIVTPDGFWMEMRTGPAEGETADFEKAPYRFGALVKEGKTYRNDGDGWYATDRPPGIGLDPATAALLPQLLRNATDAKDAGSEEQAGATLEKVTGEGKVEDIPGVVAVDGEPFTELTEAVVFSLDDQGRLAKLRVVARNTNLEAFDLIVETVITFDWTAEPGPLPDPVPVWPGAKG